MTSCVVSYTVLVSCMASYMVSHTKQYYTDRVSVVYRSQDAVWTANAHKIIPALMGSTDMLMCGEDLGFVPRCVPPVMHDLGVIGLRIQRMPGSESPIGAPLVPVCLPVYVCGDRGQPSLRVFIVAEFNTAGSVIVTQIGASTLCVCVYCG